MAWHTSHLSQTSAPERHRQICGEIDILQGIISHWREKPDRVRAPEAVHQFVAVLADLFFVRKRPVEIPDSPAAPMLGEICRIHAALPDAITNAKIEMES